VPLWLQLTCLAANLGGRPASLACMRKGPQQAQQAQHPSHNHHQSSTAPPGSGRCCRLLFAAAAAAAAAGDAASAQPSASRCPCCCACCVAGSAACCVSGCCFANAAGAGAGAAESQGWSGSLSGQGTGSGGREKTSTPGGVHTRTCTARCRGKTGARRQVRKGVCDHMWRRVTQSGRQLPSLEHNTVLTPTHSCSHACPAQVPSRGTAGTCPSAQVNIKAVRRPCQKHRQMGRRAGGHQPQRCGNAGISAVPHT